MKKLILYSVIGLALMLIKDNQILAAAKATDEAAVNIELKGAQEQAFFVTNYIPSLNELLNSVDSPVKEQKIKEKLDSCIGDYRNNKIIIQFFENNKERLLKFIDGKFLARLILYEELELFKIFLCRENVNQIIDYLTRSTTVLIDAVDHLNPAMVEVILNCNAEVNQIISDTFYGGTALGRLISKEAATGSYLKKYLRVSEFEERLNKIRKIAAMLFERGARIELGTKIIKNDLSQEYNSFNIQHDTDLIDLRDNPGCKIVFEEYEKYQEYKKTVPQRMMEVEEIAMFPPGLLPICVSYLFP